jgi:hypothetical protein
MLVPFLYCKPFHWFLIYINLIRNCTTTLENRLQLISQLLSIFLCYHPLDPQDFE